MRAPLEFSPCTHAFDPINAFVTYEEAVLLAVRGEPTNPTVFIASHSLKDVRYLLFAEYMTLLGGPSCHHK